MSQASSESNTPKTNRPGWNLGHLCQKLRLTKGWSLQQLAHRAGLRDHDIVAIEENHTASADVTMHRLVGLERAFGINMFSAMGRVDDLNAPDRPHPRPNTHVLPFVTPQRSIHQNSFVWTADGVLTDTVDHAPHLSVLPQHLIRQFIGKQIVPVTRTLVQRVVANASWGRNAVHTPQQIFNHYQRLLTAAKLDQATAPLRYEAKLLAGETTVIREVTCVKLSANAYETQTHVIHQAKRLDVRCCGRFQGCAECFLATAKTLLVG